METQTSANHVGVCSIDRNHANSEMPRVTIAREKVIFVRCVEPDRHKFSKKGRSTGQQSVKLNSYESNFDDEGMGSDNRVSDTPEDADGAGAFGLYKTGTDHLSTKPVNSVKPYVVNVQLGKAQVDTGASRSTVSKHVYDSLLSNYPLQHAGVILRNYSGEKIPVVGKIYVSVKYENQEEVLDLIVVEGNLPALFWARLVE